MLILSIETSCDDTGVALLDVQKSQIKILADFVSSQTQIHAPYGGVVPNLAVRAHYKNLPILLEAALKKTDPKKIDLVAVTIGPGLEPCLWAGVRITRALSLAMKKPIVGVNHLEGHIAANWLQPISGSAKYQATQPKADPPLAENSKQITNIKIPAFAKATAGKQNSPPKAGPPWAEKLLFPAICLIVSGGHTQLVLIKDIGKYKIIGRTRDDAAGEAFDKVAKLLGLGYPGGPEIALKAKNGNSGAFKLPRPMIDTSDFDFSFSGLKTAVLYLLKNMDSRLRGNDRMVKDICASFQQTVVDVLVSKTIKATVQYKVKTVMLSGGVAANQELRHQMARAVRNNIHNSLFLIPDSKYCADNAVMIGLAGYWKYNRDGEDKIEKIVAKANLNL